MEDAEGRLLRGFDKYDEFVAAQGAFLMADLWTDDGGEDDMRNMSEFDSCAKILAEYQEQSYLLDPFLEGLVTPVIDKLKFHARDRVQTQERQPSGIKVNRLAKLLYEYIKCRGYKTIIRFFPHEVADLPIALDYMLLPGETDGQDAWALRYVMLLWMSLICMIPFDLAQFDDPENLGKTASTIDSLGKSFLDKAGLEREGAAILLSRLYMRKDTDKLFDDFLAWIDTGMRGSLDLFACLGILHVLCDIGKSGPVEQVQAKIPVLSDVGRLIAAREDFVANTTIRKLRVKLLSRIALRLLPARTRAYRRGRVLAADNETGDVQSEGEDIDVPEEIETLLEEHFAALQDKDTIVRWSAAKGVASISERLPADFADQVLSTVLGLFDIHYDAAAGIYEMPALAEATWHGACLATAEMVRRGCVPAHNVGKVVEWMMKALYFDIRKGTHSVGSSVRDAACYVLWSLARAQDVETLRDYTSVLSSTLVSVCLFDREVHVRRAASAGFQEHVGRTGLFPHGIDVLRKADFYAVGIRRNSFLSAAPEVAEHTEYRPGLIDHLHAVTLRHWDPAMRVLGAQALREICALDLRTLGPASGARAAKLLQSADTTDVHGGLLALAELAAAFREQNMPDEQRKTFGLLALAPGELLLSSRHEHLTAAACLLIGRSISRAEIEGEAHEWRRVVDCGLRSRSAGTQDAAAHAMAAVSALVDCEAVVQRFIQEARAGAPLVQQGVTRLLGLLDYDAYAHALPDVTRYLLETADRTRAPPAGIEVRRNCFTSMHQLLSRAAPRLEERLPAPVVRSMFAALLAGLGDYTTDERGDVGSWVRMACIEGLAIFAEVLGGRAGYLTPEEYHDAVAGILKQGVERLDNVRACAGTHVLRLLSIEAWPLEGDALLRELFLSDADTGRWSDGEWLYPRAVRLLEIARYRAAVLDGLVISVASRTDHTQRAVAASLVAHARTLPIEGAGADAHDLAGMCEALVGTARRGVTSNTVVVPILQTFVVLLEGDALEGLGGSARGLASLRALLGIVTRSVARLKNLQRILASMRITVNLMGFSALCEACVGRLPDFLTHETPKVRADTAECLYLFLQSRDIGVETDAVDDVLLETEWSIGAMDVTRGAAERIRALLSENGEERHS